MRTNLPAHHPQDLEKRFWERVDKSGDCWVWTGAKFPNGYGEIRLPKGNATGAHRISWFLSHGEIPKGLFVCHKCDNRLCVNPDHLFLENHEQNMKDMVRKNRAASGLKNAHHAIYARGVGSKNGRAKLNETKVIEIRNRFASGEDIFMMAEEYKVTPTAIRFLVQRKTWTHIP